MSRATHTKSSGAVTVEFALVVPLLVMLVFGITELGRALYQLNTLTKATSTGARYLARLHGAVDFDTSNGNCSEGTNWDETTAGNLVLYGSETAGTNTLIPDMSVEFSVESRSSSDSGNTAIGCVIVANSSADYTSVFGDAGPIIPFTNIDAFSMSQKIEERYIGE